MTNALFSNPLVSNPWIPVSGCGPECVSERRSAAGTVRLLRRTVQLVCVLAAVSIGGLLSPLAGRRLRHRYWRAGARLLLAAAGIDVQVRDRRPARARRVYGALIVANHISFLDALGVAAVVPSRFVAKSEVAAAPLPRAVARAFGLLTHRRGALRQLPGTVAQVERLLDAGRPVTVFPEGTTWCGTTAGRFHPAFFQAAIDAGVPVLPMRLDYRCGDELCTAAGYLGADSIPGTLARVMRMRGVVLTVTVWPPVPPAGDRRALARYCRELILPVPPLPRPQEVRRRCSAGR